MAEQELRVKIAKWVRGFWLREFKEGNSFSTWEELPPDMQKNWLKEADKILALIKKAGWIDPATVVMPGEFGTPKAAEMLHEWATANGYVQLAEDQSLPEIPSFAYDKVEDRELLQRGAINYSKMFTGWRKVKLEVKDGQD